MVKKTTDLLIVGAGPAGLECARRASELGLSCLVIEKAKDFLENNFSSGAAPRDIMTEFGLPESVIDRTWSRFQIYAENQTHVWEMPQGEPPGVILDFSRLREFLKQEAKELGASFFFHTLFISSQQQDGTVISKVKHGAETWEMTSHLVIDATGGDRKVIHQQPAGFSLTGSEVWADVPKELYNSFDDTLTFYLGPLWFPQGYGWVFPKKDGSLKAGVIRYFQGEDWVPHPMNFSQELVQFIESTVGKNAEITARHGKGLTYFWGRKGPHVQNRIVAVGDAAGALNALGCEGLRYALQTGRLGAEKAFQYLSGDKKALEAYEKELSKSYNLRWRMSEWVAKNLYREDNSKAYTLALELLQKLPMKRLMNLLFNYDPLEMARFGIKFKWKRFWLSKD